MSAITLRPTLTSYAEIETLGGHFGAQILGPLIAKGLAPVIAAYGPRFSGKTTLGSAALRELPEFFSRHADDLKFPDIKGHHVNTPGKAEAFRYSDFGKDIQPGQPITEWPDFIPRQYLMKDDVRYKVGLDWLEHPPIPLLEGADFIILTRKTDEADLANRYYIGVANGIAGHIVENATSFEGPFQCRHPRTRDILSEMRSIREITAHMPGSQGHSMTFILGNDRPEFRAAFENFREALGLA